MTIWDEGDDRALIEAEAKALRAAGDLGAAERLLELLGVDTDDLGAVTRDVDRAERRRLYPDDELVVVDPLQALGDVWHELNANAKVHLEQAQQVYRLLGADPSFSRAIGVYVGVAYEAELRHRVQEAYKLDFVNRGRRQPEDEKIALMNLWRFLHEQNVVLPHCRLTIEGRNHAVHSRHQFLAAELNDLLLDAGLIPGEPGAFHEVVTVTL
ncbi:MAG: hypothetical protein KGJ86_03990 [Chloroflexota bacterium]|nr:hypothetical protein [Chloroflexota bacterium]